MDWEEWIGEKISTLVAVHNRLNNNRDVLSPLLFDIPLKNIVRRARIETLLFRNHGQRILLAFSDDLDPKVNWTIYSKEDFITLDNSTRWLRLKLTKKNNYMLETRTEHRDRIDLWTNITLKGFRSLNIWEQLSPNMAKEINNRT